MESHDELMAEARMKLREGFADPGAVLETYEDEGIRTVLMETALRLHDNYPYFHPMYAGQMLKPPHPAARLAYALAMYLNPNNHALDGGRASSLMEKEAVAEIARMFGWSTFLGHLCGGGTMANLEALWVSRQLHPGKKVVASSAAHYTHRRISGVLALGFDEIACDNRGRMDVRALESVLESGEVGTVVVNIGTTGLGAVDPLPAILRLKERYGFRVHADAAYGGYFGLTRTLAVDTRAAFDTIGGCDSIVIDPHKHGLQPYGCGCVLFRDPSVGRFYKHDSPYTYFTSSGLHLGEISLECSRPGASAVALWATQRLLPLERGGTFAHGLERGRNAALRLHALLASDTRFLVPSPPELDIVVWTLAAPAASAASALNRRLFEEAAARELHLALAELPLTLFGTGAAGMEPDTQRITCLRSVLMKPEHDEWLDRIWRTLVEAADAVLQKGTP
jgi:glutamate/tyrosine decarboxylase-like PLP-dependent enzyme